MIESILQIIIENKEKIEKGFQESIENNEITLFSRKLKEVLDDAGKQGLISAIENVDMAFFNSRKRKKEYTVKEKNTKHLLTEFGNLEFKVRYYQDRKTKEYLHLATEKLGIEKHMRIDTNVESKVIEFSNDLSYSKSGKKVVNSEMISKTTVMKKVRKQELKIETKEEKVPKKYCI